MFSQLRSWFRSYTLILCLLLGFLPSSAQRSAVSELTKRPQVMDSYGKLPLSFEANQGQTDQRVKFLSRGPGYTLFLTGDSAILAFRAKDKTRAKNTVLRMNLIGGNAHASVAGADELPGTSNYFVGNDPKQWRTNVSTYGAVRYSDVYPGVDLVYQRESTAAGIRFRGGAGGRSPSHRSSFSRRAEAGREPRGRPGDRAGGR